jgi:PAS domain S-box-containing protein
MRTDILKNIILTYRLMSLRIKLTLFTVGFVLLASIAILSLSILQIRQKEGRDIKTLRTTEMKRLQYNLKISLDFVSSMTEGPSENTSRLPEDLINITGRLRNTSKAGTGKWIWLLDKGTTGGVSFLSYSNDNSPLKQYSEISQLLKTSLDSGDIFIESPVKDSNGNYQSSSNNAHLYWYGQKITSDGWILAVAAPLNGIDSIVALRTYGVKNDIAKMIKDRMMFSLLLIIAFAIAIYIFSKIITNPLKTLVRHTESIAHGHKGFGEKINIASRDEIGRLAASFNAMLDHIQDSMNKIEDSAAKYRELVETANSAIIHLDSTGNILFINEYAQNLFGYSQADAAGKNIYETIGRSPKQAIAGEDMFLAPEKYPYLERMHITSKGTVIWVGWSNRPVFDKNYKLIRTLCVGSDITKRKEAEELSEFQRRKLIQADKMVTLGTLVSGIGHEINNPNNYIILNAQNLTDLWRDISPVLEAYSKQIPDYSIAGISYREIGREIPGMLQGIVDGARRIKTIVQNLKDFSRMEPDDMTQKIDIAKVIESSQIILGNLIKKSTSRLIVNIPEDLPYVRGNFQRIEQVIINLLSNACQANDSVNKPITITSEHLIDSNEISITILDTGRGIKPEDMNRIFDPFFTTRRDIGGTGLGLAVSYSIVKDHGGDIRIESVENHGTTATLILPIT